MTIEVAGVPGLDPTLPDVSLVIDGRKYQLCFDLNALVLIQKKIGKNILIEQVSLTEPETMRTVLWGALLRESPDLTEEQAGALVTTANWGATVKATLAALGASQAEPEAGAAQPTENPSNA
jgi:hypothetical protein